MTSSTQESGDVGYQTAPIIASTTTTQLNDTRKAGLERHEQKVIERANALGVKLQPTSIQQIIPLETPRLQTDPAKKPKRKRQKKGKCCVEDEEISEAPEENKPTVTDAMIDKEIKIQCIREKILTLEKKIYYLRALQFYGFNIASIAETVVATTKTLLNDNLFDKDGMPTGKRVTAVTGSSILILMSIATDTVLGLIPPIVANIKKNINKLLNQADELGASERDFFQTRRIYYSKSDTTHTATDMETGNATDSMADNSNLVNNPENLEYAQLADDLQVEIEKSRKNIKSNRTKTYYASEITQAIILLIAFIQTILEALSNASKLLNIINTTLNALQIITPIATSMIFSIYNHYIVTTNKDNISKDVKRAEALSSKTTNHATLFRAFSAKDITDATLADNNTVGLIA